MPADRPTVAPVVSQPLEVVRLEDRVNPSGLPPADAFLEFTPNPALDFGTATPAAPVAPQGVTAPAGTPAVTAPTPVPNSYELLLPAASSLGAAPVADTSGGVFALSASSVVPPPPVASISGFVYVDEGQGGGTRDDGVKSPGEPGIPGSTIELLRVVSGITLTAGTATTDAAGFYQFTSLSPFGEYVVRQTAQPAGFLDGRDTAGSEGGVAGNEIISGITLSAGAAGVNYNFGELLPPPPPGAVSGFVYVDEGANGGVRDDGVKQAGEPGIPGTVVTLFRVVNGVTTSVAQTTTDASGFYRFTGLTPGGGYRVVETQPGGFLDGQDTPGSTGGTDLVNDQLDAITVPAGTESVNNNFGELLPPPPPPARLSGYVYVDADNDGVRDPGEAPIAGVTVSGSGRLLNGQLTGTFATTTDANGFYEFTNLLPGTYAVSEIQPGGFLDGLDTPGSTGGTAPQNDTLIEIPLAAGDNSVNNNFGELLPPPPPGTLSGFVYEDDDDDGVKDATEAGIPGTTVTLFRVVNGVTTSLAQTTTDVSGFYRFTGLTPGGGYRVVETQPAAYADGQDTPGSTGGTDLVNDQLDAITVPPGGASVDNNFGERLGQLSGFVYVDADDDGVRDAGEAPIPGTTLTLLRVDGGVTTTVGTTATDAAGFYQFTRLAPGSYSVRETQPAGFNDGKDTPDAGNGGTNPSNDLIATIGIGGAFDLDSPNNNFGELLPPPPPGTLSGFVYVDEGANGGVRDDGVKQAGEPGIPGTVVTLFRVDGGVTTSVAQTTTDASGFYQFTGLTPGGGYRVVETQPGGFLDGQDTPGSTGGTDLVNDQLDAITVPPGGASVNNNFGELLPPPPPAGALSGFVYVDADDDGVKDPGEAGIPGVVLQLTATNNSGQPGLPGPQFATTDANGFYRFTGLVPSPGFVYTVRETQPVAYLDGQDTPGSTGGSDAVNDVLSGIPVPAGGESVNNNFGELLPPPPPPPPGAVSGFVYEDNNDNAVKEGGEAGIGGVTVTLLRPGANGLEAVASTVTDASGFYRFADLAPGLYWVQEAQPVRYIDGQESVGSTGGALPANDLIGSITVPAGAESVNNNFGELVCVSLYGFVWYDRNENGRFDPSEVGLPGATVTLTGTTLSGRAVTPALTNGTPLVVTTDANGRYGYLCLPVGTYTVVQTNTPAGYIDFREENAARLAVAGSTPTSFAGVALNRDGGPLNFGKVLDSTIVVPPPPVPQFPETPSKLNLLGSTGSLGAVVLPPAPGPQFPSENLPFNPTSAALQGAPRLYAVGAGAGAAPVVRVFDSATGSEKFRLMAYDEFFVGGVSTAIGDVTGDGVADVITAAGAGGGPHVKAFDGQTGAVVRDFFAYAPEFTGGVWVASGDVDGDGFDDIVTGAGDGGGAHVRVFSGKTGAVVNEFFAFDPALRSGARVAVGDFNGDGKDDIAAATGAGFAPQVATFDGRSLAPLGRFTPYDAGFTGGVFLAAGDVNGDGTDELVTGAGNGGGAHVRALNGLTGAAVYDFFSDAATNGGVRVAARDLSGDGKAEIITGGGVGQLARVQTFSGAGLGQLDDFFAFESTVKSGIFVG